MSISGLRLWEGDEITAIICKWNTGEVTESLMNSTILILKDTVFKWFRHHSTLNTDNTTMILFGSATSANKAGTVHRSVSVTVCKTHPSKVIHID